MNVALKQILENKMTQATEIFNVPKTTLRDQFRAIQGKKTMVLTPQMDKFKRVFHEDLKK